MGSIFLKDEDGYKIILRSLEHYKKRLRTIGSSPELTNAGTFSSIIQQEAMKTYPKVEELIVKIPKYLENTEQLNLLESEIPLFQKSLESYKSDLDKAKNSDFEYYKKLVDISQVPDDETHIIDNAIKKIKTYSE